MSLMLALAIAIAPPQGDEGKDPQEIYTSKLNKIWKELGTKHANNASFCESKKQNAWAFAEYSKAVDFDPDNSKARKELGFKKDGAEWVRDPDAKVKTTNELDEDDAFEVGIKLNDMQKKMGEGIAKKYADAAKFAEKHDALADQAVECWRKALEYDPVNKDARKHYGFEQDKATGEWRTKKYTELVEAMKGAVGAAPGGAESSTATDNESKVGISVSKRVSDHFAVESSTYDQARLESLTKLSEATFAMYHKLMNLEKDANVFGPSKPAMIYYKVKAEHERFIDAYITEARQRDEFKKSPGAHLGDLHETTNTDQGEGVVNDFTVHSAAHSLVGHHTGGGRPWLQEGMAYVMTFMLVGTADNHCTGMQDTSVKGGSKNFKEGAKWRTNIRDMVMEKTDSDINAVFKADIAQLIGDKTVKGWSICDFLIHDHYDRFLEFIERLRKDPTDNGEKALKETFDWTLEELDDRWRAYVRSTY